jgi:hypothetical protein
MPRDRKSLIPPEASGGSVKKASNEEAIPVGSGFARSWVIISRETSSE